MAVRFNATGDQIAYIGAGLPNPAAGWTLTMWIKLAVDTDFFATFARLSASGATSATLATTVGGTGGPTYATAGGVLTGPGLVVTDWYRYAVSGIGTDGNLYLGHGLDGITDVVSGTVAGAASPDQLCFGGRSMTDFTEPLNGCIAYPKLYNTLLDDTDIEEEWLAPEPLITGGLAGYWPLITAGDLTDHSGHGRHLSAGSTAPTTEAGPPISVPNTSRFLSFF